MQNDRIPHDDVIKWKHFPRYWRFVWEFTGHRWIFTQRSVTLSFDAFFDLRLNKRLSDTGESRRHRGQYYVVVMFNSKG